jgi:hypothetical protein
LDLHQGSNPPLPVHAFCYRRTATSSNRWAPRPRAPRLCQGQHAGPLSRQAPSVCVLLAAGEAAHAVLSGTLCCAGSADRGPRFVRRRTDGSSASALDLLG